MDSGSTQSPTFPCGNVFRPSRRRSLRSSLWYLYYMFPCQRFGNTLYDYLSNSDCSWHCIACYSINYSLGSVSDLYSFASVNRFSALHSPDKGFQPASSSTPTKRQSPKTTPSPPPALKVFHINFQTLLLALKLGLPRRWSKVSVSHQSLDSQFIGETALVRKVVG